MDRGADPDHVRGVHKGGDVTFLVEEMKAVFDPKGGYFKAGGVYMPSLVAELGMIVEDHLKSIGMMLVRCGGRWDASWSAVNPPYEMPVMFTCPSHHGCAEIHASVSAPSAPSRSCRKYHSPFRLLPWVL